MLYSKFHTHLDRQRRCSMGGIQHQSGHSDLSTSNVGLVISSENPWLADDRVHDSQASLPHGLSEYKNPSAAKDMTTDEACEKIKRVCIKNNMNTKHKHLDTNHNYYYQIQCQLYCDKKQWCVFVVKTRKRGRTKMKLGRTKMKLGGVFS